MRYKNIEDLTERDHNNLPKHAQEIYLKAFSSAWDQHNNLKNVDGANQEKLYHIKLHGLQ